MRIGIVLDNPRRDLDGLLIVAHHLLQRGHTVAVLPMYQQGYDVPWLGLTVIIVNYARPNNRDFLSSCKALGIGVIVLDSEGSVVPEDDAKTPYGPDPINAHGLNSYIDHYLFWGQRQYEYFRRRTLIPPQRLHVTGCPRYDFCHPRWQRTLTYPWQDYVLINTNFSAVNPQFTGSVEKELEQFIKVGWDAQETRAHMTDSVEIFGAYLETLHNLAHANSGRRFLIRPHPFENAAIYQRRFADCANVRIEGSGSVMSMIRNATCTLHLNCQTAIETLMMGKLPVSLEYLNSDGARRRFPLPSSISYPAGDFGELNEIIQAPERYLERVSAATLYRQHIQPLFYENDGQAGSRVADIVESANGGRPNASGRLRPSVKGGFDRIAAGRLIQGTLCNLLGSRSVSALRARWSPHRKTKNVTCSEIRHRLAAIAKADGQPLQADVSHGRHPVLKLPMATIMLRPIGPT